MLDQAKLLKQAWDMKRQMDKVQKELKKKEIVIQRSPITITISGDQVIKEVKIDPEAREMQNVRDLEHAVKNAVNQAIGDSQELARKELKDVTGDLSLPGMPGLG